MSSRASTFSQSSSVASGTATSRQAPKHTAYRIVQILTGITLNVQERNLQVTTLKDRCARTADDLDVWSDMWDTREMRDAGATAQQTLVRVLSESECWQQRWFPHKVVRDDLIQRDLTTWDLEIRQCMESYNSCVLHEILRSLRNRPDVFQQDRAIDALRDMSVTRNPQVQGQLQELMDAGYNALRSDQVSQGHQDAIFRGVSSILTPDNVPESVRLKGDLTMRRPPVVVNPGSDIYQAQWRNKLVAVKVLRESNSNPRRQGRFLYEATIWRMLIHPNVLPFYGLHILPPEYGQTVALVSLWAEHGDALGFLLKYPQQDRCNIIKGTAYGIAYLHRRKIVHGAIRASNILIDREGRPMLTDFGLASAEMSDQELLTDGLSTSEMSTTIRWLAPELTGNTRVPTFPSDIFSFARTILEIMTGEKPFKEMKNVWQLASLLNQGKLVPSKPQDERVIARGLTDDVWSLLLQMWQVRPEDRPTMRDVEERLESLM